MDYKPWEWADLIGVALLSVGSIWFSWWYCGKHPEYDFEEIPGIPPPDDPTNPLD